MPAATSLMPVDEIKAGHGRHRPDGLRGHPTFRSSKPHILGVLHNVQGPHRNLILARLEGGPLAKTGVAAGMSGSPVYIDGRLIGAVSYSIGSFPTEAIAGITPIGEMTDATQMTRRAPIAAGAHRAAGHARRPDRGAECRPMRGSRRSRTARLTFRCSACPLRPARSSGAMLRPISTPLVMSGFEPASASTCSPAHSAPPASRRWWAARVGGQGGAELEGADRAAPRRRCRRRVARRRRPRDGRDRHDHAHRWRSRSTRSAIRSSDLGPAQFPLTRAYVYAMLPSLMSSFKISSMGDVIGTMQQDRATAIAGTLGKGPAVIPMSVTLQSTREDGSSSTRTFNFTRRQRSGVHAAARLRRAGEHALRVRTAVRRGHVHRSRAARRSRDTAT